MEILTPCGAHAETPILCPYGHAVSTYARVLERAEGTRANNIANQRLTLGSECSTTPN